MQSASGKQAGSYPRGHRGAALLLVAALLAMSSLTAQASANIIVRRATTSSLAVNTQYGPVVGTTITTPTQSGAPQDMDAWEGIPFAAPPVGPLRWEPPQPPAHWTTPLDANTLHGECPQGVSPFGILSNNEDCLYLNVFAPPGTTSWSHLPVMVWFFGGAFAYGGADLYDPDKFVNQGVIVVTLNYRVGIFGFFGTPQLDAEPHSHINYGIMDQQAALSWVHSNIANFGGNPSNTTIFGQSAGGLSVIAQLVSPAVKGLFQHAIIESGAIGGAQLLTQSQAEAKGTSFAAAAGCGTSSACLRGLTAGQIVADEPLVTSAAEITEPAVDGTVIPQQPLQAILLGQYNHVPTMQGSTLDEYRLFTAIFYDIFGGGPLTAAEYPTAIENTLAVGGLGTPSVAASVEAQYPLSDYPSPDLAFSAVATDSAFSTGAYLSDILLSLGTPVYAYEFSDQTVPEILLPPVSFPYGAAHATELEYLFDEFRLPVFAVSPLPQPTAAQEALSANMVSYWTSFAKSGNPNNWGSPLWLPFNALFGDMNNLLLPRPQMFTSFTTEHKTLFWVETTAPAIIGGLLSPQTAARVRLPTLGATMHAALVLRPRLRTLRASPLRR